MLASGLSGAEGIPMTEEEKPKRTVKMRVEPPKLLKQGEKFDVFGHIFQVRKAAKKDLWCTHLKAGAQALTVGTKFVVHGVFYEVRGRVGSELIIRKRLGIRTARRVQPASN